MSNHSLTLVKMINQIAANTPAIGNEDAAAAAVAAHIKKFWAKPMRVAIKRYLEADGGELNKRAAQAVRLL